MLPGEDATAGRPRQGAALRYAVWMMWIRDASMAVALTGVLILAVNLHLTATWSRQKVGFLVLASAVGGVVALPGALVALGHTWAGAMFRA